MAAQGRREAGRSSSHQDPTETPPLEPVGFLAMPLEDLIEPWLVWKVGNPQVADQIYGLAQSTQNPFAPRHSLVVYNHRHRCLYYFAFFSQRTSLPFPKMAMVRKISSSSSSAFLAMPVEIRLLVCRFCIPQNKCFNCSYDKYCQNRAPEWDEPLWHWTVNDGRYDTNELYGRPNDRHYVYLVDSADSDGTGRVDNDNENVTFGDYCSSKSPNALPGILLLCRQINDEVTPMLYGGNTFKVILHNNGQSDLARRFNPETRKKMRKILLVLRPMGVSYKPSFRMDPSIWNDIFDRLAILGIIAEQPEPPFSYQWPQNDLGSVFEEWKTWLTSILEYLAHAVPDTAQIVVDANEEWETENIIKNFMPERCRFQCLQAADSIFKRGPYSLESGYWDDDGPNSCRISSTTATMIITTLTNISGERSGHPIKILRFYCFDEFNPQPCLQKHVKVC